MSKSSLTQYIDLYDANRGLIDRGSATPMNLLRDKAREVLDGKSLPDKSTEGYSKTSLNDMFASDFGVNIGRVKMPVDVAKTFRCDVPNLSTMLAVVANDEFVPTDTLVANLPEGVNVMSLTKAAHSFPQILEKYYGSVAPLSDVAVALNTMLAQNGVLVWLRSGVKLQKPLQIVNILATEVPLIAFRRILVVAERGSKADIIICDHTQNADVECMSSQVTELVAEDSAEISIVDIEESTAQTRRLSQIYVRQAESSIVTVNTATLLNGETRNEFNVDICGGNAQCHLGGMAIGSANQHIDNSSNVRHLAGNSESNQRFRYVLDDNSTGAFEGGIEVAIGAKGTRAYQSNGNILASKDARMHTNPRLLIYNDDVKCSHGASTGQLDESALFYMQSRGIPRQEARTMLMQAFVADVIERMQPEAARDRLRHLVEKRFSGTLATCHDCSHACKN